MKYLVGKTSHGHAVFAVQGENAIDLTALDANVGTDLMALINDPALVESVLGKMDGAPSIPVA